MDLFTPVVAENRFHPNFSATLEPTARSVRTVLQNWSDGFIDRDGKFVQEFQTTYNSSFWELYLFAVFKELGLQVDFDHVAPDFVLKDHPVAIEATIASNAHDDVPEWEKTLAGVLHDNLEAAYTQSIIRMSNAFHSKAGAYEGYSEQDHMDGRSYIIAISNYGTQDFNLLGDVAMQRLLYDVRKEKEVYKANRAPVRVGLFNDDSFAHVSAVMYSAVATFGKARALSDDKGAFVFSAVRIKDNLEPIRIVAPKNEYEESLTDGLRLFTNPFASNPIDPDLFDDAGIRLFVAVKNGELLTSCHPEGDLCMRMVNQLIQKQ